MLEDTEYRIPSLIEDDKKLLDIIMGAIGSELQYKGRLMAFYDDFGKLTLRKPESMLLNLVLGAGHYLYDYSLKKVLMMIRTTRSFYTRIMRSLVSVISFRLAIRIM